MLGTGQRCSWHSAGRVLAVLGEHELAQEQVLAEDARASEEKERAEFEFSEGILAPLAAEHRPHVRREPEANAFAKARPAAKEPAVSASSLSSNRADRVEPNEPSAESTKYDRCVLPDRHCSSSFQARER